VGGREGGKGGEEGRRKKGWLGERLGKAKGEGKIV
jgi:hypothetical protein